MNLVEWLQRIMIGFGAAWVMWLMLVLSVVSVAMMDPSFGGPAGFGVSVVAETGYEMSRDIWDQCSF